MDYNVGMGAQFSENTVYTNKGFSSYNGLLVSLQKNLTNNLQFDINYTWSHSIDNVSLYANQIAFGGYGFICDVVRPRECRGNSDFDTTNYVTSDFTYSLPFGRGRQFASSIPWWADELIGGWDASGILTWHSGEAYSTVSQRLCRRLCERCSWHPGRTEERLATPPAQGRQRRHANIR